MNTQRESFKKEVAKHMESDPNANMGGEKEKVMGETHIIHNEDGTHTVHHHDGEQSGPHPSMAHAGLHIIAKHQGGEQGLIEPHAGGGATTHHVGLDGEVQGPMDHESEDEGYSHLKSSIGEGSDMAGEEPIGGGRDEDDSTFE